MKKNIAVLIMCILSFGWNGCNLGAGSYSKAEYYTFNVNRNILIKNIETFKNNNIEYKLKRTDPQGNSLDGFDDFKNHYIVYFYIKKYNMTILSIVKTGSNLDEIPSYVGLSSITYSNNFSSWKMINTKDLTKEGNDSIKRIFESEILDKLGKWEKK